MRKPHGPLRLVATMLAAGLFVVGMVAPASAAGPNLSPGKATQASSSNAEHVVSRLNDGDPNTYWESANNAFPQWARIDLGAATSVNQIVLKVPPASAWQTRTQTLSVQGGADGSNYSTVVASANHTFNPASGNTVTINFGAATHRYWRVNITANTGWPAAQISEFEVYGASSGGDVTAPSAPANLAYTQPASGQIRLTWNASTDNTGVTGYDVYANNQLRASVGNVTTYTDTQPASATVTYFVRAKDAAGNLSSNSNSVTRTGTGEPGTNLATGKEITASGHVHSFVAANANDGNLATYWEANSGAFPNTLTVKLGANSSVSSVVVKLNPDSAWGTRTQNIQVLGREQSATTFQSLAAAANHTFNPASGNTVTIPVSGSVADVQLRFTSNTGAPGGQVAEFQVFGVPAPNPDLTVTNLSWTPASPTETSAITLSATVRNSGTAASAADSVNLNVGGSVAGTVAIPALAVNATATVTHNIGTRGAGSYVVSATVDADNTVFEQNEGNNTLTASSQLVVGQAPGPDLQVVGVTSNPPNPAVGAAVSFTVAVNNRGISASGTTSVTRVTVGGTTLNGTTASIAAGATVNVAVSGTWTATSGGATITATADATNTVAETNETNNTFSRAIVVGRGAAVPYVEHEAEAARYQGTLLTTDPLRTFGHTNFATESSGRQSVRLNSTGQFVEFTSTAPSNSIVVRNSIPDAPGGGGIEATISLYINDTFSRKLTLSSRHSWLYGNTDGPEALSNTPQADARRMFDESHALLASSYPAGTRFKLQRDATDTASFYIIDLIDLEQVAPPASQPAGCTSITTYGAVPNDGNDDTAAIQRAVTDDQNGVISCVWIPAGQWRQEKKILTDDPLNRGQYNQVGISDVTIRGAGMWHSQLYTLTEPHLATGSINHPHEGNFGFDIDDNVQISDIAIFGSGRIRGGEGGAEGGVGLNGRFGKDTKISNVWIEHANVGVWVGRDYDNIQALWGPGDGLEFTGMRIRNTYADGINFTNGTRNSRVFNSSFRYTGDDSLAVWANRYVKDPSVDIAHSNAFVNNTIQLPWRANGIAIYGGYGNRAENNLVYDTMNYPGIMLATDHDPLPFSGQTLLANNGLYRTGGAFWNEDQEFGAITLFAATVDIPGVTIRDTDIVDSTYDGIQFKNGGGSTPGVAITNVRIDRSNNGAGILAMSGARGSATLTNVTITNSADGDIVRQPGTSFVINGG
ncbi:CARDB domain-containing protein [Sphaerisporangium sp. TRM90804]|uniref:CARDB domain-containing protein n=1 Tax=Sphaerisporangium sp. TRM90804 TaxID=3031113 RepID=UPI0024470366|nr:CARDB domain-containing protein [Sphaerisporangium sp. TRM90804]MDH2426561.1 CARDB domain-containing protein [Sphaerisporangium sp. TRM90804]